MVRGAASPSSEPDTVGHWLPSACCPLGASGPAQLPQPGLWEAAHEGTAAVGPAHPFFF